MTKLVSACIKAARSFFVQIRNLDGSYSEEMSEVAQAYLTSSSVANVPVVPELKQVLPHFIFLNSVYTVRVLEWSIPTPGQSQHTSLTHFHRFALPVNVRFLNVFCSMSHSNCS
jgi:hypothetical protein